MHVDKAKIGDAVAVTGSPEYIDFVGTLATLFKIPGGSQKHFSVVRVTDVASSASRSRALASVGGAPQSQLQVNFTTSDDPDDVTAREVWDQHGSTLKDAAALGEALSGASALNVDYTFSYAWATYNSFYAPAGSSDANAALDGNAAGQSVNDLTDDKAALVIGISAAVGIALVAIGLCLCLYLMNRTPQSAQKLLHEYGAGSPANAKMPALIDHTASNKSAPSVRRGGSQMEVVGGRGMGRGGGHLAKVEMGVMGAQI